MKHLANNQKKKEKICGYIIRDASSVKKTLAGRTESEINPGKATGRMFDKSE